MMLGNGGADPRNCVWPAPDVKSNGVAFQEKVLETHMHLFYF